MTEAIRMSSFDDLVSVDEEDLQGKSEKEQER